jgi:predicted  nucleic acid-binding Zn-ribbon protein
MEDMNTPHDHDHNDMTPLDYAQAHNNELTQKLEQVTEDRDIWRRTTEIWKSRAAAHEENYQEMLRRVDELSAENKLWEEEAKRWRDMYMEYDEMLEGDLEKAKERIANVMAKIKSLEKEMKDNY